MTLLLAVLMVVFIGAAVTARAVLTSTVAGMCLLGIGVATFGFLVWHTA